MSTRLTSFLQLPARVHGKCGGERVFYLGRKPRLDRGGGGHQLLALRLALGQFGTQARRLRGGGGAAVVERIL
jgi:hypothetical protein